MANGIAVTGESPCVRSVLRECPSPPCSSPGLPLTAETPVLLVQNQQELRESSGDVQAGGKKKKKEEK